MDHNKNNEARRSDRGVRWPAFVLAWLFALSLWPQDGAARRTEVRTGAPGDWVQPVDGELAGTPVPPQVSEGLHFLLVDLQTRVDGPERSSYRHFAVRALNEKGVESVAHVEVPFDPSYQTLTLHAINVLRQGRVFKKLPGADIRILQREKELEARVYDGSKTANVFIEDVRIGDVVEYAYTLRGTHPAMGGRQFGRFDLQWSMPVQHLALRLLWPAGRPLHVVNRHTDVRPEVRDEGAWQEYRWRFDGVEPLLVDNDAPAWFDPYPAVQWSEFADWSAVARWAQPLYRLPPDAGGAVRREAERIGRETADPRGRALAALRFVQREIRYLGVEVGAGSYQPNPPGLVLQRRFGDCKDKTLLTLALFEALGIEAAPALVNTRLRKGIADLQPSPAVFNHVLVRARIDGQTYWLDPTRLPQSADLDSLHQPDYGRALVVQDGSAQLLSMQPEDERADIREVLARFDVGGKGEPAIYTVTTISRGAAAEEMRARLSQENREDLQKRYLNHYARYYPGLEMVAPMRVTDDDVVNQLTTVEHYRIPAFWTYSADHARHEGPVHVPDVNEMLRRPAQAARQSPLATPHPFDMIHVTELRLPEPWPVKPEVASVKDEAFTLERTASVEGQVIRLTDHLQWHVDHVTAARMGDYVRHLDEARGLTNYELYWNTLAAAAPPASAGAGGVNWPVAMLAVMMTGVLGWLAWRVYCHDPARALPPIGPFQKQVDIGGWLLLPALGLVVTPLRLVHQLWGMVEPFSPATWASLTTAGAPAYHPWWAPLMLMELGVNLAMLCFGLAVAALFFKKRRTAPRAYVILLAASTVCIVLDHVVALGIPAAAAALTDKDTRTTVWTVIWAAVWCAYFLRSERVRQTFLNDRSGFAPAGDAPAFATPGASCPEVPEACLVQPWPDDPPPGAPPARATG